MLSSLMLSYPVGIKCLGGYSARIADGGLVEDRRCRAIVKLDSNAQDTANWYEIWQGLVAVEGMCGRFGRCGVVSEMGMYLHGIRSRGSFGSLISFIGNRRTLYAVMLPAYL